MRCKVFIHDPLGIWFQMWGNMFIACCYLLLLFATPTAYGKWFCHKKRSKMCLKASETTHKSVYKLITKIRLFHATTVHWSLVLHISHQIFVFLHPFSRIKMQAQSDKFLFLLDRYAIPNKIDNARAHHTLLTYHQPLLFVFLPGQASCTAFGNTFVPNLVDGCASYYQYTDPASQQGAAARPCPGGTLFDVVTCTCQHAYGVTCGSSGSQPEPGKSCIFIFLESASECHYYPPRNSNQVYHTAANFSVQV